MRSSSDRTLTPSPNYTGVRTSTMRAPAVMLPFVVSGIRSVVDPLYSAAKA
jgi:hypothetical protein